MQHRPATVEFPLLALIDRARGNGATPFSGDPHAAVLELRALELAAEYWPETVWLTGAISGPLLDTVAIRLEAERLALLQRVRVFVSTELPATHQA